MAKEIERVGIPVVQYSALPTVPLTVGAPRVLQGKAIPYPLGDPFLTPEGERAYRRTLVEAGLRALQTPVSGPTLFKPTTDG